MTGIRNDAAGVSPKTAGNGRGNSKSWAERPARADGVGLGATVFDGPPTVVDEPPTVHDGPPTVLNVHVEPRFTVVSETTTYDSTDDEPDDGYWTDWYSTNAVVVSETPEFDRRVRRLLGVTDQSAPVTTEAGEGQTGTESTPEGWNTVTIACAGRQMVTEGHDALPRMLRRVEHADAEPVRETVMRYLGRATPVGVGDVILHSDTGRQTTGHITGLGGGTVYLRGSDRGLSLSEITHIVGV